MFGPHLPCWWKYKGPRFRRNLLPAIVLFVDFFFGAQPVVDLATRCEATTFGTPVSGFSNSCFAAFGERWDVALLEFARGDLHIVSADFADDAVGSSILHGVGIGVGKLLLFV